MKHRFLVIALVAAVFAGCESTSSSSGGPKAVSSGGNSLWDQIAAARAAKADGAARPAPDDPSAGAKDLPPGWKATIDAGWVKFLKDDPSWPEARAAWIALGPPAPLILAENLFRAHVLAFDAEDRRLFMRTRVEILERRSEAVPFLVAGLASGGGDTTVRNLSEDLLGATGDDAARACVDAWSTVDGERGRRSLARVMKKSKSRVAVDTLIAIARSNEPFATRLEAVEGLGEIADPKALPVLVACVRDADPSVAKFASHWVSVFRDRSAIPALVDALERGLADRNDDLVAAALRSLNLLAGRRLPAEPARWRALIAAGEIRTEGAAR